MKNNGDTAKQKEKSMKIQEAIRIAYEKNKWIQRQGDNCKIKPTNNDFECCLIKPSENYPKNKKKPSRYWNPKYIDLVSDDWEVVE